MDPCALFACGRKCSLIFTALSLFLFRQDGESGERHVQDEELQEQGPDSSGDASKERGGRNTATQTEKRGAGKHTS